MNVKKNAVFSSLIALLLCVSMLVGATFAWFTDGAYSGINTIAAGVLDVELYHSNAKVKEEKVDATTDLFLDLNGKPILWEPGVVSYENLRVVNEGDLALAYQLSIATEGENYVVDSATDAQYGLSQILKVGFVKDGITATEREDVIASVAEADWVTLADFLRNGKLLAEEDETWGVVICWQPGENDNLWNLNNGKELNEGETLQINLGVNLVATQEQYESDTFGSDYDTLAYLGTLEGGWMASAPVVVENGLVSEPVTVGNSIDIFTADVPAGVKMADGEDELVLNVNTVEESAANVQLAAGQIGLSIDVHMDGVAEDNTVPMAIHLGKIAPAGLYDGNIVLYHVEDGATVQMTQVTDIAELDAHNEFYYNASTGEVTIMLATFSEVYAAISVSNPWDGTVDTSWYSDADVLTLSDAADLAGFAKLVAEGNTFEGKTVKLGANVNMGGDTVLKDGKLCFHPIGVDVSGESDTVAPFKGTFDGDNHTISNIYQNTWMLKGHYSDGYYNEAMGLFGLIDGGTVKNLVIDGMVAEGEYTDMGCITAYARGNCTFDNIRITNVSMYCYNCRTAGIVGYDWIGEAGSNFTFSNIEIDPSCTFGALWGSWDVACAGILGYKDDASKVVFNNCEVGCVLDVYNDVCGNYQYYQYRYAGMMIGTVGEDSDPSDQIDNGNITFTNCAVHYGDWVNYYYCEFEKNSMASYSEDYQFSRVPMEELVFDDNGNVIGCTHDHTAEEDKQAVHIPFGQILTGYGWGATPKADGTNVTEAIYTISYAYGDKIYDVTYVTDNSKEVSTANTNLEDWAESWLGGKYKFSHWMNAGSTPVSTIPAGNTTNVVLYPSFKGVYTATFVDLNGNVLASDTYTNSEYSNIKGKQVTAPAVAECKFDYWEVRVNKGGNVTNTKLSEYGFADNMDITIYPVYTYNGKLNLKPHDLEGDGITNYYTVESASGLSGDVVVPGSVNGIPVTSITDLSSDLLNTQVTSIEIKEGVQEISANAFALTTGLKNVIIPSSVISIGENAFANTLGNWIGKTITITYDGTWEEYLNICAENWERGLASGTKVVCSDGTATLKATEIFIYWDYDWTFNPNA